MAYYLLSGKFSQESMNALVQRPENRLLTTTRLLQGVGGRLHYYFFCFGDYDFVLLYELPDNTSAAALAMVLTASGSVSKVCTGSRRCSACARASPVPSMSAERTTRWRRSLRASAWKRWLSLIHI